MKKFLSILSLMGFVALFSGVFSGCKPNGETQSDFSASIKEVGPEYVQVQVKAPAAVQVAYILDTKEKLVENPVMIFAQGETMTVKPDDVIRISSGLKENTQFYLYIVAKLDAQNYSQIVTLPFKTTEYDLDELITVVDQYYDGYKMRITVPEETKERGNAIRYNQCCIMMYNYMKSSDDYFSLLHNAAQYTTDDVTLVYSEDQNWYQTDGDSDGDGELDWDTHYNPISPGEPVVYVAGEFAWMEDSPEYETEFFKFPSGWENGYYIPMIDTDYYTQGKNEQSSVGIITDYQITRPLDAYWTGAFQRKHFRVREPELLDGKVDVKLAESTPKDIVLEFYPDENVKQYAVGIFDDSMYENLLELCNGREDYIQWAITSYFAAYTFGTRVAKEAVQMKLTTFYYQDAIAEDTEYHVLVTAMGDAEATKQSFQKYTFKTAKKTKDAPVIEVTSLPAKTTPYEAYFNIKCTTVDENNPVTECYYAANYLRDWLLAVNGGATYFSLVQGNKAYSYFTEEELAKINSPEGYDIAIPSMDGETTRLVILGYNDEYTPNDLTSFKYIEECPGVADCTTPWVEQKKYVEEKHYTDLVGDWTATATLQPAGDPSKSFIHKSKITIAADLYDYPAELPQEVYDIYKESSKYDETKVDALWEEFKQMSETVTNHRLKYQNRLVAMGWLDKDSYDRLDTYTPYELFIDKKYKSVDVSSIFNDYGPKWYIEAVEDEDGNVSLIAPFDSNFLPPAANWSIPFYFAGMELKNYYTVTYGDGWTPAFPLVVSEDRNTITMKPLIYKDEKGNETALYPQMIGIDNSMMQTFLENPVVSDVVLTRGWKEPETEKSVSVHRSSAQSVQPVGDFPVKAYKQRTDLDAAPALRQIEGTIVTADQFKERADRFIEMKYKQNNK